MASALLPPLRIRLSTLGGRNWDFYNLVSPQPRVFVNDDEIPQVLTQRLHFAFFWALPLISCVALSKSINFSVLRCLLL